jgi:hypothetical protein
MALVCAIWEQTFLLSSSIQLYVVQDVHEVVLNNYQHVFVRLFSAQVSCNCNAIQNKVVSGELRNPHEQ